MSFSPSQSKTLFERLSLDRQQNADVLEKCSMRGIKQGVVEKYSDTAHFLYELLQNADDAMATKTRFVLNPSGIQFAHNGTIHFSITEPDTEDIDTQQHRLGHINAITSIGNSNKYEAQIGKFGVGFKAVFEYTNTPEIYDPNYCFTIERFIVPRLLTTDHPDRQAEETLFYFPFDNPYQSARQAFQTILVKLKNLLNPLLFLRHLTEITWSASDGSQGQYTKSPSPDSSFHLPISPISLENEKIIKQICCFDNEQQTSLTTKRVTTHFLLFTRQLALSDTQNLHLISIAYLLEAPNEQTFPQVCSQQTFPAYCFFATKEMTQLRFIVQAPFLLTDNREGIKHEETWNQQLIQALAQLVADSLPLMKEMNLLTDDFFNVLPINEADFPTTHLFCPIYDAVLKRLQSQQALLPTQQGSYVTKPQAYLAEHPNLLQLLTSQQLSQIVNNQGSQWVFPQTTPNHKMLWEYVKTHLAAQEITQEKLLKKITKEFIQAQNDAWLIQFYTYLIEKPRYLKQKKEILRTKPILRLTDEQIVSAYHAFQDLSCYRVSSLSAGKIQVYLPSDENSEYPTVKACFAQHDKSLQFLRALGLEKPNSYEEIQYYIFRRYQQAGEIEATVMGKDFRKLFSYFLNCPGHQKAHYLQQLKNLPFCRARCAKDNRIVRTLASVVYFQTKPLQHYFQHEQNIYFLDTAFYAKFSQPFGTQDWTDFWQALGVEDKPRLLKIAATLSVEQRQAIHQGKCTHDYYHSSQYTYDYDMEGLEAFLSTHITLAKSKWLWQLLLKLLESGQDILKGQYHWFYRRDRYYYFDAKFLTTLRQTAWLYNQQGECITPATVIVPELSENYDTESYVASVLLEKLGIKAERLSGLTAEQRDKYAFGEEVMQLAASSGQTPAEVLNKWQRFLAQKDKKRTSQQTGESGKNLQGLVNLEGLNQNFSGYQGGEGGSGETMANKPAQLPEQFAQQQAEITQIEALQAQVISLEKYSFAWFNTLLELEYLLHYHRYSLGKKMTIKFSQVEKDACSDKTLILKHPSRYLPHSLEDIADLSLQLRLETETKNLLIEVVNVKDFTLRARLKSVTNIQELDLNQVQTAIIEINNPTFWLEKLKAAFRQLPYGVDDDLQTNLTTQIEFIFGPPGTGKTTYLAREKIIPLMRTTENVKVLVLTPTNNVADGLVKKMMAELRCPEPVEGNASPTNGIIRFGVTGDSEIERTGLLKDKTFEINSLPQCVVVTTITRFFYDGFSTCLLKDYHWDVIIFEEASMIMLAQIVYVLYQAKNCYFMIGGDPFQIQPVVLAEEWKAENIYTLVGLNNFQALQTYPHDFAITTLTTQYRSIPPLGTLVSEFTYRGILTHHRPLTAKKLLPIEDFHFTEMTVIKFPVNPEDSIYRSQRLEGGGAYHIYSAIFTVELALYFSKQLLKNSPATWKIGIVCPYLIQATLVEKMLATLLRQNSQIQIQTGTVHSFQGEEFDLIFTLFNAPPTISPNIFLNNQNLLNVAISRAKDYLILILPDINGLETITTLETILASDKINSSVQQFTAFEIEQVLFHQPNYISENTFITTHQRVNVYTKPDKKYEVRCEDNAIDILLDVNHIEQ